VDRCGSTNDEAAPSARAARLEVEHVLPPHFDGVRIVQLRDDDHHVLVEASDVALQHHGRFSEFPDIPSRDRLPRLLGVLAHPAIPLES